MIGSLIEKFRSKFLWKYSLANILLFFVFNVLAVGARVVRVQRRDR